MALLCVYWLSYVFVADGDSSVPLGRYEQGVSAGFQVNGQHGSPSRVPGT